MTTFFLLIYNLIKDNPGWVSAIFITAVITWYSRDVFYFVKDVNAIRNGWSTLLKAVGALQKDVGDLLKDVGDLKGTLSKMRTSGEDNFSESQSPQALNKKGRDVADIINAQAIAEKYANKVQVDPAANAYDIQESCFSFALQELKDYLSDEERESIKGVAYNNGVDEKTIFHIVIGIVLRDEILKNRDIDLAQVDKHAPSK